ncbi:SDR family NAD(P)-dependent oxidoreductase [Actinophytocola gossypii]|uniref:SDR family NAD(P)-dependent oxidoreductase n=1 Tax=Actinophytocola gossypii TaxID=2812003 RepID=A0ABT2JB57_9PSEU|nr:SDR family NAD(P)-dependent oxidoreductase [Actinophytocola gossypii]MCT2585096.1 SDR family NAD(P)-dependent oxidoreductase [Actinophytocola gossypii]
MSDKKVVVITGASDGIGAAAARRLHANGHTVVVVGRSAEKTRAVATELGVDSHVADFTRLDDVERLAGELGAAYPRIDVLANNAGGVFGPRTRTVDGFEKTFQINHLAPFLLTRRLLDTLVASRASVLQTSSTVRFTKEIDLDDLDHDRNYDPVRAYGAAKLENILFTTELHRRYHADGLSAASFYPGNVWTNFAAESTSPAMRLVRFLGANPLIRRAMLSTPDQGADQIVWLAEGTPGTDWRSGAYYYKRRASRPRNAQALDAELARGLWERSEQLLAGRLPT